MGEGGGHSLERDAQGDYFLFSFAVVRWELGVPASCWSHVRVPAWRCSHIRARDLALVGWSQLTCIFPLLDIAKK